MANSKPDLRYKEVNHLRDYRDNFTVKRSRSSNFNRLKMRERHTKIDERYENFSVGGIFRLIIAVILAVTVLKFLLGSENTITFRGFLETLTNAPQLNISNLLSQLNLEIIGDWGIFEGIRIFLNSIISIFNVIVYFCLSIAQGIVYIGYFLRYLFLG